MSTSKRTWRPWGDHPLVVIIFVIAALIPIGIFVKEYLPKNTLSSNSTVLIRIADESGNSIVGAKVIMLFTENGTAQFTDSNGTVSFTNTSDNQHLRIVVETDRYEIYEMQLSEMPRDVVNIRLSPRTGESADVILRAVDSETELPISNAEITLVSGGDVYKQVSDSDGFVQFTLDFPLEGKLDTYITVSAEKYKIENEIRTLLPGKLQYLLLSSSTLSVQIPSIQTVGEVPTNMPEPTTQHPSTQAENVEDNLSTLIGSGVEISQQEGRSGLRIVFLKPDSQPWEGVYVEVYKQIADASGNPSPGEKQDSGYINRQGQLDFEIQDGTYAVCPGEKRGYGWTVNDCIYNIPVSSGSLTTVKLQGGQIEFALVDANGKPWENIYIEVYTQKQDVNGNPVTDDRVWSGYTANTGIANIWLTPGLYAVSVDLRGYNWGALSDRRGEVNVSVQKAMKTPLIVKMGQVVIGLTKPDGTPNSNAYVQIYTQKSDINNQPVVVDRIWSGYTDNGGFAVIDLTQGMYALTIDDVTLYSIPVSWGAVTRTNGSTYQQE